MAKATFARNAVLNALLRATALTGAATVYMSLHSGAPGADGTANELSGNAYARTAITFGDAAAAGAIANTGAVTFPDPTPSDWAEATHFALWSASSGGNCYYVGTLAAGVTATVGVPASFPIGAVDITED